MVPFVQQGPAAIRRDRPELFTMGKEYQTHEPRRQARRYPEHPAVPTRNFIAPCHAIRNRSRIDSGTLLQSLFGSVRRKENRRLELIWAKRTQRCQPSLSDRSFSVDERSVKPPDVRSDGGARQEGATPLPFLIQAVPTKNLIALEIIDAQHSRW